MGAPPSHGSQERAERSWITFISKESGFKIQLPVQPEHEILTLTSKKGTITHNIYSAEEGGFIFTIDCADLPSQFAGRNDAQDILSAMQEELLKEVKATKTSETVFQLHNYSGREVRFDLLGGQGRMRLILVGPRLYQLLVTRLDVITKSEEPMARFLQSFTLLDTPATIKTVLPL
jgi:hypothetical protein